MTTYNVSLQIDPDTRQYLQGHGYTLYVFKGIDAGGGAVSTVWQTISGDNLYNQNQININWEENYYIGETITSSSQSGVVVSGVNPYISSSNIQAVKLGCNYIYSGVTWNPNPTSAPSQTAFFIENDPSTLNNFYVSQKANQDSGATDYIVVQGILGDGGTASFTPIQTIALILSTAAVQKGAIVIQAFSPGVTVTLGGSASATLSYNKDSGWNGPSSQVAKLPSNAPIYTSLLQNNRSLIRA